MIYGGEGSGSAWIGGRDSENGLGDVNEVLEEYGSNGIKVANLDQGEEAVIALSVMLDGITGGNTYQGVDGTIQFCLFTQVMTQMHRKPLLKRFGEKIKSSRRQSKEKKGLLCGTAVLPQTGLRQVIRR